MTGLEIFATVVLALGVFTSFAGAIGIVRFPDFYSRVHAAGKGDTLGQLLVLGGLLCIVGVSTEGFKLLLIIFFIMVLNPTATHALVRAAWVGGLRPWRARDGNAFEQREGQMTPDDWEDVILPLHLRPDDQDEEHA